MCLQDITKYRRPNHKQRTARTLVDLVWDKSADFVAAEKARRIDKTAQIYYVEFIDIMGIYKWDNRTRTTVHFSLEQRLHQIDVLVVVGIHGCR